MLYRCCSTVIKHDSTAIGSFFCHFQEDHCMSSPGWQLFSVFCFTNAKMVTIFVDNLMLYYKLSFMPLWSLTYIDRIPLNLRLPFCLGCATSSSYYCFSCSMIQEDLWCSGMHHTSLVAAPRFIDFPLIDVVRKFL